MGPRTQVKRPASQIAPAGGGVKRHTGRGVGWRPAGVAVSVRPMKYTRLGASIVATAVHLLMLRAADDHAILPTNAAEGEKVVVEAGDGTLQIDTGKVRLTGGILARGRGVTLTAREGSYDEASQTVEAEGEVVLRFNSRGEVRIWRGEQAQYNFATREVIARNFRLGQTPFFATGKTLQAVLPESGGDTNTASGLRATLTEASVTTDDIANPSYRITAGKLTLEAGKSLKAEDARFYAGSVPFLHLSSYTRNLERHENFWSYQPGYRNRFGPFLESEYHWFARTNIETIASIDWRQRRGLGGGPGLNYDFGEWGTGGGRFYYAHDDLPDLYANGLPTRTDRNYYNWQHAYTNQSGLTIHGIVNGQNDPLVLRDFYEGEFRRNPQPKSFFEVNQAWSNWTVDLLAQPQVIDFYQTVERLPDLKLTGLRQQVGSTPLYYDSESSVAYLRLQPGLLGGTRFAALRADTYHQLTVPQTYFGWLNFLPRAGGRFTYYGDPEGPGTPPGDQSRGVFNTGAEVNFKASRVWTEPDSRFLDVHGLRHIVVPSVNYVYVPVPSARPAQLPQFDTDLPSPRLLPIEFPDYNAIDSVDSQNTLRFGLFNQLQTKRRDQVSDLVTWNLFTDWRLRPRPNQDSLADIFSDLEFLPRNWLIIGSETRYDVRHREWAEANHRITLQPNDVWHWTVGHRYLRDDALTYGAGNNLLYSSLYWRFSQNWGARAVHYFEGRDGRMEEQAYSLYRDFRAWTSALTFRLRDQRVGGDDWSITLSFSLKAFPRFGLNADRDKVHRVFGGTSERDFSDSPFF